MRLKSLQKKDFSKGGNMKIETDDFLFITSSNICGGWEEVSPGIFKFKGVKDEDSITW